MVFSAVVQQLLPPVFGKIALVVVEVTTGEGRDSRRSQEEIIVDNEPLVEILSGISLRKRDILFRLLKVYAMPTVSSFFIFYSQQ